MCKLPDINRQAEYCRKLLLKHQITERFANRTKFDRTRKASF